MEVAKRRGLLRDDTEYERCMAEAVMFQMPQQLRTLFCVILLYCNPTKSIDLWNSCKAHMAEDFMQHVDAQTAEAMAFCAIEGKLKEQGRSCSDFGIPSPTSVPYSFEPKIINKEEELRIGQEMYTMLNQDQRSAADDILATHRKESTTIGSCFFIDGPGGTGKTYLYNTLCHLFMGEGVHVMTVAWAGIAASLLPEGRTVHSRFKLPVPILETSTSSIRPNSKEAEEIRKTEVIICDEAPMAPSWIVPYNPYLLMKYSAHINVESCATVKSIKYLFTYIYKGHDCANIKLQRPIQEGAAAAQGTLEWDEIKAHLDARYVSVPAAVWRLFEFPLHDKSYAIIRLAIHLPNQQPVYFAEGNERQALERAAMKDTTLTAWFKLNSKNPDARQYLYHDISQHFVFERNGTWKYRLQGENVIGRMYSVSSSDVERYHLRLLLLYTPGACSFDDLKTVDGQVCQTFMEAAKRRGLLCDDTEYEKCICSDFGIPSPTSVPYSFESKVINKEEELRAGQEMYAMLNQDQRSVADAILGSHGKQTTTTAGSCFFIDGPGGTGKTYLYNTLYHLFMGQGVHVMTVAWTGIASSLLPEGRTVHSRFKLPVPILKTSTSSIRPNSKEAEEIRKTQVFIWDEAPMAPCYALNAV
ncbi:unnamed protein product, partial [Rotaria sp. Silwood1]